MTVPAAAGRRPRSSTSSTTPGRPVETRRAASWDLLAAVRERTRADRRARALRTSGNGPRPGQRPRTALWAAVPAGYRPAGNLSHWLGAVSDAAHAGHRSDAAERRVALAWVLAKHTDWGTCTSRCGWALLADRGGVSYRTVARFLAWLRAERLLAVVSTGRTGALTRPMALTTPPPAAGGSGGPETAHEASGNEAAVYVLLEPVPAPRPYQPPDPGLVGLDPRYATGELTVDDDGRAIETRTLGPLTVDDPRLTVDEVGTPYRSPLVTSQNTHPPAHPRACTTCRRPVKNPLRVDSGPPGLPSTNKTRPNRHPVTGGDGAGQGTGNLPDPTEPVVCERCHATRWARHVPASTAADRLALADRLRHDAPPLAWVGSARRVRWLLRDFLHAGWTAEDLLHALDTHPETGPYAYATSAPGTRGGLRNPAGWVLHRLKPWRQADGIPVAPFSRTHAAALAARRAEHAAQVGADRRTTTAATGPTAGYRTARAAQARTHRTPPGDRPPNSAGRTADHPTVRRR